MNRKLDDGTNVPIKWVFILLSFSGSALVLAMTVGIWVSKIEVKLEAAESRIEKSDIYAEKIQDSLFSIDQRLSRIEGKMGIMGKK